MVRLALRGRKRRGGGLWRLFAVLLASLVVALVRYWPSDVPDTVDGQAHVIDGDSIKVNGEEIRLVGIDAPESRQMCQRSGSDWGCGKAATRALNRIAGRQAVRCDVEGLDKYDRLLAVCWRGDIELNAWLVRQGWALSYGDYRSEEAQAQRAKRGVWVGEFMEPRAWRDEHMSGAMAAAAS